MKRSQFPKGRMSIVILLLIAAAAAVVTLGCPHTTPDPPKPPIDEQGDGFSWTSPNTPKESVFSVAELVNADTNSRAVAVVTDGEGTLIEPTSFKAAYSYIALVPQSKVQNISDKGLQACWTDSDWLRNDGGLCLDDNSLIPGFWERRDELPYNLFEAYLDDTTPVTRDEVKDVSFPLYDSTEQDGALKIFDVTAGTTKLTLENTLPEDLSVTYCGVAADLIFYEVELEDYGLMRFFFNDHPDTAFSAVKAGDVLVHKGSFTTGIEDGTGIWWQWAYLKHGDGPDQDCFTDTCDDPRYNQVKAPDPLPADPDNWDWQDYNGSVTYQETGPYYAFIYDSGPGDFSKVEGQSNSSKRPAGTGSFSYWMMDNSVFNGTDLEHDPYTSPRMDDAVHIGGFKDANLNTFGTYASGWYQDELDFEPDDAFLVHHEQDYHLGNEDRTSVVYYDSRQEVLSRDDFLRSYGWYGYDSGLLSNIYDDSIMIFGRAPGGGSCGGVDPLNYYDGCPEVILNPLHFAVGRMQVYADAPPGSDSANGPTYTDSWFDRIISLDIQLQLGAALRLTENNTVPSPSGMSGAEEFEYRFLTFIPDWDEPSAPPPRPYSFNGKDDLHKPPIKFMIIPEHFSIQHNYLHYSDVYTLPPQLKPDPLEGPFDSDLEITITKRGDDVSYNDRMCYFYTLNGDDPIVNEGDPLEKDSLTAGADTYEYSDLDPIAIPRSGGPVTVKVVAYEQKAWNTQEMKKQSIIKEARYTFKEPGHTLELVVQKAASDGNGVFAGLFSAEEIDLNYELSPLFHASGTIENGGCNLSIPDIPTGTYYLCVLIDKAGEGEEELSPGDAVYPAQTGNDPGVSYKIDLSEVVVPAESVRTVIETDWTIF